MLKSLNFKHLYYFWVIAREGSLVAASKELNLAPQTLSGQLSSLEESLGGLLFNRKGRRMTLTQLGRLVLSYADDMFRVAGELQQVALLVTSGRSISLAVGISASIHKLFAYRMLEPALHLDREVKLSCRSGTVEHLVQELLSYRLDIVLADRLPPLHRDSQTHWRELESSSISLFAKPDLARTLRKNFPLSLDGQPLLATTLESPYFQQLMRWLGDHGVKPVIKAEIDDSALVKVFGARGLGVFAAPTVICEEVLRQYQVELVGSIEAVTERLYAVTRSARSGNPAVEAICLRRSAS
ncbi:LysR family transcriptional regulator [Hahella sp. KA22]|uniref:LysR family transcriptional regulator n=1 Tax=Hahella sp. KA22 TaxID=1628392 RepID=UPI000FDE35C4|nr:LysR family transcriptional regulator [Hahella sp. KA22]AZZ92591.1 LysR family transcriptional regulator [Hahella sp. KA22]QAY55964.1 LysR family transcriptional regulator [Hahella sp. KA22]